MSPKRSFLKKFFILPVFVLIACLSGLQAQSAPDAQRGEEYEYRGYIPFEPEDAAKGFDGQTYDKLFDGDANTKWAMNVPDGGTSWTIQFATKDYVRPSGYCMVTADDTEMYPGRNPKSWRLEGKTPDGQWYLIDEVSDETLPDKNQVRVYKELDLMLSYCEYRLTFTGVNEENAFQLSEFFLLYKDPDTDVRKPWIRLHPNTILAGIDPAVVTGDNRSTVTLGGDPYNQEAYTLLGWNTHPRGTGTTYKADDPYFITQDATVYAMWEPNRYDLTIYLDTFEGSPVYKRISYTATKDIILKPKDREGYIFKYWIVTSGGGSWKLNDTYDANKTIRGAYGNATLAGCWEKRKEIEVSWYSDGNLIGTESYYEGDIPEYKGDKPSKKSSAEHDFNFIGWDKELTELKEDTTFNAVFEETRRSYEITWLDEDGNVFDISMVEYDSIPSHEDPVKKDSDEFIYTFIGWDRAFKAVAGPETYVARFEKTRRKYEITWKDDDGKVIDITKAEYGSMPTHPDPDGKETVDFTFTFDGWTPALEAVTGDAEYTARYNKKPRNYPVHFEMNGAAAMKDASVGYGKSAEKPETPQYSGFFFDGWFADKELNKPYTFEEMITGETTIYAKWTAIKPAPVLSEDEKPTAIQPLTENGQPQALINAPKAVPEGYTVEYSLDGSAWSKEIPTGTKSGEYTVRVFYRGDNYHTGFTGENLTVKIQGVYKCDATTAEWTKKSGKTVAFRITKEFDDDDGFEKFAAVTVDGVTAVRDKDYTAVKGSTIITFNADFLETLSLGEHAVKVSFEDGEASVGIKVIEAALTTPHNDTSAQTGDSSHLVLWIILALVSIGAIVVLIVVKRKKE